MRNIFDQYNHPENRLTHGLMSSLAADPALLRRFIQWATGERAPTGQLHVLEQTLPGEEEPTDEEEAERKGLPDGWIHDNGTWSLVIESKVQAPLKQDQLHRHRRTAEKRGFTDLHILALVSEQPNHSCAKPVTLKKWTELYIWLLTERQSEWAHHFAAYMEALERRMIRDDYLKEGMLTVFAGIPFGKDNPYNYLEAKRVLRLAMDELRQRNDLKQQLGMDPNAKGRTAITGRDGNGVWDFLPLNCSKGEAKFTKFPHLTLSIQQKQLSAMIMVPHGIRGGFRKNLLAGGRQGFCSIFEEILDNFNDSLEGVEGIAPWIGMLQRRYLALKSEPITDASIQFDLRTGFQKSDRGRITVKEQPQWLGAAYDALSKNKSNLELGVGGIFRYERCSAVHTPEIVDYIAAAWLACKPLMQAMIV